MVHVSMPTHSLIIKYIFYISSPDLLVLFGFQVAQNGEETSYMKVDMPQKQSQMWIPAVQDEHKMNLTLPNCMGWRRC